MNEGTISFPLEEMNLSESSEIFPGFKVLGSQNGCYPKVYKQSMLERVWRKGNPLTLLVGMQTSTATMENSVEIP